MPFDGLNYTRSRISTAALKARLANQANSTGPRPRGRMSVRERDLLIKNRREWLHDYSTRLGHAMQVVAVDQFSTE